MAPTIEMNLVKRAGASPESTANSFETIILQLESHEGSSEVSRHYQG